MKICKMPGHLTPRLLEKELADFREAKGFLLTVLAIHMTPDRNQKSALNSTR